MSILFWLWLMVSSTLTVMISDKPVEFMDLYGNDRVAVAAVYCELSGQSTLFIHPPIDIPTLVHELAHAYDCQDDGLFNGSPLVDEYKESNRYCGKSRAEFYACQMGQRAKIRSQ